MNDPNHRTRRTFESKQIAHQRRTDLALELADLGIHPTTSVEVAGPAPGEHQVVVRLSARDAEMLATHLRGGRR